VKNFGKILSVLLLLSMLGLIFYLGFDVKNKKPYEITLVELNGCSYLPTENYFKYAELENKDNYPELTLPIIKSRFEKHPYIKKADVIYAGNGKVEVYIKEKSFKALVFASKNELVITQDFELLPVLKYTQHLSLPIITLSGDNDLKPFEFVKSYNELFPAYEILDAVKIINPQLYDNLSEIDLSHKKNIGLYFTFADYPVKVIRGREIENVYVFNRLWEFLDGNELNRYLKYIDLRYQGKVFLGLEESIIKGTKA
jgi:cell division protein FtsQ